MKRILLTASLLLLAGCQSAQQGTTPPAEPQPFTPPAAEPGAPVTPPITSAGPLRKAAVGTYMDAQEADLRSYLRGQGVLVARRGDSLVVTVPVDRLFEKMEITPWGEAVLISVAQVLAHFDHSAVEVGSYTDSSGSDDQNLKLSQRRATAVSQALARNGIAPARLAANGYGAASPKASDPRDPRNRRIELKITPTPSG